jgi:CelD/BcsL family acetyltransferase involved in cellulose biosynthesis
LEDGIWHEIDLSDEAQRDMLVVDIRRIAGPSARVSLAHDPAWLLEAGGRTAKDIKAFVLRRQAEAIGYAPLLVQPWNLSFRLGENSLFAKAFVRFHMNGEPLFSDALSSEARVEAMVALLMQLQQRIQARQLVSLEGVIHEGLLDVAVAKSAVRSAFAVLQISKLYERSLVRLPRQFDDYMKSLKPQTRQNLRNTQRKLERHLNGDVSLVKYTDAEEASSFVERAVEISRKTYQWHLLGLGLRQSDVLRRTLIAMARQGWMRCYLLECGGIPTSFMIGYLYGGTYYYIDVGFDPEWEQWSVGTVLHLMVLRDLIEAEQPIDWFDFSSGTGVHKKRFGNVTRTEKNYVLLPRSVGNLMLAKAYMATDTVSTKVVHLLDKLHLKSAVKRFMRRTAIARTGV